jgi:hypothetical protein
LELISEYWGKVIMEHATADGKAERVDRKCTLCEISLNPRNGLQPRNASVSWKAGQPWMFSSRPYGGYAKEFDPLCSACLFLYSAIQEFCTREAILDSVSNVKVRNRRPVLELIEAEPAEAGWFNEFGPYEVMLKLCSEPAQS